jgi:hypothetical protein
VNKQKGKCMRVDKRRFQNSKHILFLLWGLGFYQSLEHWEWDLKFKYNDIQLTENKFKKSITYWALVAEPKLIPCQYNHSMTKNQSFQAIKM